MPEISLTTFVDFVIKSGSPRLTCVRDAKRQYEQGYSPEKDFWRPLREAIIQMHRKNRSKQTLDRVLNGLTDLKKRRLYPSRVDAYKRWVGRKNIEWSGSNTNLWESGELTVRVNPELGVTINESEYLIKLYFKNDQLSKQRVDTMLFLLQVSFSRECPNATPAILDVARSNLIEPTRDIEAIDILLDGEAVAFVQMWNRI